eukprot:TRINITY_DN31622_c0_g1_i1.p1 TRINITY_DN31622_c0_g1~~TRINITY_DN31622_c0_g1_i1.p1  ORF type:complete len:583 (+),score=98.11 TRINITY_DN31622_c0_g1_i1:80-1828(+)
MDRLHSVVVASSIGGPGRPSAAASSDTRHFPLGGLRLAAKPQSSPRQEVLPVAGVNTKPVRRSSSVSAVSPPAAYAAPTPAVMVSGHQPLPLAAEPACGVRLAVQSPSRSSIVQRQLSPLSPRLVRAVSAVPSHVVVRPSSVGGSLASSPLRRRPTGAAAAACEQRPGSVTPEVPPPAAAVPVPVSRSASARLVEVLRPPASCEAAAGSGGDRSMQSSSRRSSIAEAFALDPLLATVRFLDDVYGYDPSQLQSIEASHTPAVSSTCTAGPAGALAASGQLQNSVPSALQPQAPPSEKHGRSVQPLPDTVVADIKNLLAAGGFVGRGGKAPASAPCKPVSSVGDATTESHTPGSSRCEMTPSCQLSPTSATRKALLSQVQSHVQAQQALFDDVTRLASPHDRPFARELIQASQQLLRQVDELDQWMCLDVDVSTDGEAVASDGPCPASGPSSASSEAEQPRAEGGTCRPVVEAPPIAALGTSTTCEPIGVTVGTREFAPVTPQVDAMYRSSEAPAERHNCEVTENSHSIAVDGVAQEALPVQQPSPSVGAEAVPSYAATNVRDVMPSRVDFKAARSVRTNVSL